MRYLFINSVCGRRSTGKIVANTCRELAEQGHECLVAYGRDDAAAQGFETFRIGGGTDTALHILMTRTLDLHGFCSKSATRRLIARMEEYKPDVIWLHNLHGYYVNIELLFDAIKRMPGVKVFWTLHDCWAFTGHCAYFTAAKCDRWRIGCGSCPQRGAYPKTFGPDMSARNWARKRRAFTGVGDLTLITPSRWLASLTRESFLNEYPVRVVNNTVDTGVFRPTPSGVKTELGIEGKHMVLGVAVGWEETKGMPDILMLRERLDDSFVIVLVGSVAKRFLPLPKGIIGVPATKDQTELARIYTAADVLINPTHQDNYPTVNLEATACGTPVVTYDVGGSGESAEPANVVAEGDVEAMAGRIRAICRSQAADMNE